MKNPSKIPTILAVIIILGLMLIAGLVRLEMDSDVTRSLPNTDPVIADALNIFAHHPMQQRLAMDVGLETEDQELLFECSDFVEKKLKASDLFAGVGMESYVSIIPELMIRAAENLPILFTAHDLESRVKPLLSPDSVRQRLVQTQMGMQQMDTIGQSRFIAQDPLGLKDIVMERLSALTPSQNIRFRNGKLISRDGRHVLITAIFKQSGTDTQFGKKTADLMQAIEGELQQTFGRAGQKIAFTPVGAYRAALDNEHMARRDIQLAGVLVTVGIVLLLLLSFPRPLLGLLSLVPALAGTITAFFVFSLFYKSISPLVVGFGGTIVSFTVDYGMAFLLFLDRTIETNGKTASREVKTIGLVAASTSVGAFGVLAMSGFPVLEQLGAFSSLGILFSYVFVHAVFPKIFPAMPAALSGRAMLQSIVDRFALTGRAGLGVAAILFLFLGFFTRPAFDADLGAMNTVSQQTLAAEKLFSEVWGDFNKRASLMIQTKTLADVQTKSDGILSMLEQDIQSGTLTSAFSPSMLFPGKAKSETNFSAWRSFWNPGRVEQLKQTLRTSASELGFSLDAFEPFLTTLESGIQPPEALIPEKYFELLGVVRVSNGGGFAQMSELTPGSGYRAEAFFNKYHPVCSLFDGAWFGKRLGQLLSDTFTKMLVIIVISVTLILFVFFLSIRLTCLSLLPSVFALVCTLGTLQLIGTPLNLASLMLSIIIFGMGSDYPVYFIGSWQRYGNSNHAHFALIRMTVFLASVSTVIGFGALCFAEHALLKSIGITALLGIGYSLLGTFVILPPILEMLSRPRSSIPPKDIQTAVLDHYRNLEAYPKMFARIKMMTDPILKELPCLLDPEMQVRTILDIGSGYGVPAVWCAERFKEAVIYGIEPDGEKARVASMALGHRGNIRRDKAPNIPDPPGPSDLALMVDMMHYLDDQGLKITLKSLHNNLRPEGLLILRTVIPSKDNFSWLIWVENLRLKIFKIPCTYRSDSEIQQHLVDAGFEGVSSMPSGAGKQVVWFWGKKGSRGPVEPK
jgi:uncharacterized protein